MARNGIKDKVAIIGCESTRFAEHWDKSQFDLLFEASQGAFKDAGIQKDDVDATWVGIYYYFTGLSGATVEDIMKFGGKPATRVENYCASGMDAFRNACFAVASGAYDVVMACGVEKLMDEGGSGLPGFRIFGHPVYPLPSAPAMFCLAATRCFHEYGWTKEDLARVAVKNHANGAHHPKAHFRRPVDIETVMKAPMIADPLGRFDCCAMSDGAAALILTTPELAPSYAHGDDYIIVKANAISCHTNFPWYVPPGGPGADYVSFPATVKAANMAYKEAGIENPRKEIDAAEVHDCFTITELLNCEDLRFCERGKAPEELKNGTFNWDGETAVNPSGGLKSFGHPIGSTGCRMLQEITKQLQGRAEGRQVPNAELGLCHNLGGAYAVCSVTILGKPD
ncbi:MAG: 3-ketoacyl-CoA thiolase (AcaB-2) [Promethearchaeota archaeon]|nr:MAG: 3-ketoacyl-CoA thiolase (AcaB-2) [Candidatus Lokiarchaeota archaeon]